MFISEYNNWVLGFKKNSFKSRAHVSALTGQSVNKFAIKINSIEFIQRIFL